ncbi:MAG: pyrroline-5-carboxylate reductase [Myxococcales bacterium]|nr:pyrroline-5-carboxylate reductase [Myxococcales bacterium]
MSKAGTDRRLPARVSSVGAGNMAEAILRGLIRAGADPDGLSAADPLPERRELLSRELGISTTASNAEVVRNADLVLLAVKPVSLAEATAELPGAPGPIYLSIVAGATLETLAQLLGPRARVVRAMPNTPALIGAGISAICGSTGLPPEDLDRAEAVLAAVGRVLRVPETQLDAVTGLSGSGPAYVYRFVEALTAAGVHQGLAPAQARELAVETVCGAAGMLQETGEDPAVLRARVSSPGGTTLAGLSALETGGFADLVSEAVEAATRRSRELSAATTPPRKT